MPTPLYMCQRCARSLARANRQNARGFPTRPLRTLPACRPARPYSTNDAAKPQEQPTEPPAEKELGPMARRLQEATEDALLTGGRAGRKAVEEAGFDEELKNRLLNKIADAKFRGEHAEALSAAGLNPTTMSSSTAAGAGAGAGTRDMAAAQPWTGEEATSDTVLRMLHDARKPLPPGLRGKPKIPDPVVVDMRLKRAPIQSPGERAAAARDRANAYGAQGLSEKERDELRKEFRERFSPGFRAMPNSISGLAAMANERIEDAIARGQFRDIPRGPGIERDKRADNPFIDTTEYIMNKMIQRQEIVPPWIEKQQEVAKAAQSFRARLRNDWRRHAARTIASRGGTLQQQMERARGYARAEREYNPRRRNVDDVVVPTNVTGDPVMTTTPKGVTETEASGTMTSTTSSSSTSTAYTPFRDPSWEAAERSYMDLAINNLNNMTRSYNLMAPELAKKPYFTLERELRSCYADVAPQLADTIKDRAARPAGTNPLLSEAAGRRVLNKFVGEGGPGAVKIHDSKAPHYGLKEMWKDFWKKP